MRFTYDVGQTGARIVALWTLDQDKLNIHILFVSDKITIQSRKKANFSTNYTNILFLKSAEAHKALEVFSSFNDPDKHHKIKKKSFSTFMQLYIRS